ncbi:hypothetical protein GCM10020216_018750 [Nonomuraea helvata]
MYEGRNTEVRQTVGYVGDRSAGGLPGTAVAEALPPHVPAIRVIEAVVPDLGRGLGIDRGAFRPGGGGWRVVRPGM